MFLSSVLQPTKSHTYPGTDSRKKSVLIETMKDRYLFIYLFIKLKPLNNECMCVRNERYSWEQFI